MTVMAPAVSRRQFAWLAASMPAALCACTRKTAAAPEPVDLLVETDGDLLEFKPKELSCHAADLVRLTFRHTGRYVNFQHNWVLILPGTFDAITAAATEAGEQKGWLPVGDERILAFTPMCGRGQTMVTQFTAPGTGDYLFICTYPGHAQSMWGVLHVLPRRST